MVPRLWHYAVIVKYPDTRLAGFGSLFGYSLALALVTIAICVLRFQRRRCVSGVQIPFAAVIVWVGVCTALHPESWWARYVPQLWLVPVLAAAMAFGVGWQRLALVTLAPATLGAGLSLWFWVGEVAEKQTLHDRFMAQATAHKSITLADGWRKDHAAFTIYHHMKAAGVDVRIAPDVGSCDFRFGMASMACARLY